MDVPTFLRVLETLEQQVDRWDAPVNQLKKARSRDPFQILVSTLLSSRTQDPVTAQASRRLFEVAPTPEALAKLSEEAIAQRIYPVGFYRTKARHLKHLAQVLLEQYHGQVPRTFEDLVRLPGVGRKTANLVLSVAFGIPAICVDTHVHRITNRLGLVNTKTPEETEAQLRQKVPQEWWHRINHLLVAFGQTICLPRRPKCLECPVLNLCERRGLPPLNLSKTPKTR